MPVDLLLRNGLVYTQGKIVPRSVAINTGLIEGIYETGLEPDARKVLDCSQSYILPGMIDAHVHLRDLNQSEKEDYASGTMAAAAGGVTTVIDMPNTDPPVLDKATLEWKIERAQANRFVNVGFFTGIPKDTADITSGIIQNVLGIKVYPHAPLSEGVHYNGVRIRECLKTAKKHEIPLLVHPDISDSTIKPESIEEFFSIHGCVSEVRALEQFIFAQNEIGGRLHICHVSCAATAKMIEEHRAEESLTGEVCPHHLFLTRNSFSVENGVPKVLPPLRSSYDCRILMDALKRCTIDIVVSDHAPHTSDEKNQSFLDAASGIPGLETTVPIMLTEVFQGRVSWVEFLRACCSGPATIFGLRTKGVLAKGYDADIIVVSREENIIRGSKFYSKAKITPFEGRRVVAKIRTTIVGGKIVFDEGRFLVGRGIVGRVPLRKT